MEHKELVEKYVNGELDDAGFTAEFDKLDEAGKKTVTEGLKEAKPRILSEISGLRKEREKVREQKVEAEKPPEEFIAKFRSEQIEKAKKRFLADKELDDTEKATLEANFTKLDDGAIDADLIAENLKRVYAYSFPDKALATKVANGAEGAADFISRQVTAAATTGSPREIKEDDPRIARILKAAREEGIEMTAEEAKRGLLAGQKGGSPLKPLPKA